ncbi:hypothetical protein CesoFtcFv8_020851 [Champsocephalus esox]|uniref:Uncharacterized protein n=1 Tax=Champsocephalus esox TaxID=159716 RepID=A0AAN8GLD7_9TELE|nr:hypothetical protein CesoFtcFv8_020851 [Champsocephalus esox]
MVASALAAGGHTAVYSSASRGYLAYLARCKRVGKDSRLNGNASRRRSRRAWAMSGRRLCGCRTPVAERRARWRVREYARAALVLVPRSCPCQSLVGVQSRKGARRCRSYRVVVARLVSRPSGIPFSMGGCRLFRPSAVRVGRGRTEPRFVGRVPYTVYGVRSGGDV